jgi:hypothetical protein
MIAGAAVGALVIMAAVFGVVFTLNANYVTRAEYVNTVKSVERSEAKLDAIVLDLGIIKGRLETEKK